jgi:Tfp pilus assembly protein PilF
LYARPVTIASGGSARRPALAPADRADAYYQLALAWFEAGDLDQARRSVLRALEVAPSFEPAQQLLLRIRERRGSGQ